MNFLDLIEGQRGELLYASVLLYLLQRSPEMRDAAINVFSERSGGTPLLQRSRFSVEAEKWQEDKRGRIDLLMELDNAIVGVEIKLNAAFTDGQPLKYLNHLRGHALRLAKARGHEFEVVLIVLAPRGREKEVRQHLAPQSEAGARGSCPGRKCSGEWRNARLLIREHYSS